MQWLVIALIGYFIYGHFFGERSGCKEYASEFSCSYVKDKANYDVYYWKTVWRNNPEDERYIGSVTGLSACRDRAILYGRQISDSWSERSYICVLDKDGKKLEKHRL